MRIKAILNLGEGLPPLKADEIADVDDQLGAMLVARSWAIELPPEPVPEPPKQAPLADKFEAVRNQPGHIKRSGRAEPKTT